MPTTPNTKKRGHGKSMSSNVYNFPILRYGSICSIVDEMDLDKAEKIGEKIRDYCKKTNFVKYFADFIKRRSNKYSFQDLPTIINPPSVELREGWVVLAPRLEFKIKDDNSRHNALVNRISIVICMKPNHSKIWINLSFKGTSRKALNLSIQDAISFFEKYEELAVVMADFSRDIYQNALSSVLDKEIEMEPKQEIFIRTVGSSHNFFKKVENNFRSGKSINFTDEFECAKDKKGLKDFLFFVFNEEINTAEEYNNFIDKRKKEWLDKKNDFDKYLIDKDIEESGMQFFGLKWNGSIALLARKDELDTNRSYYVGIGAESNDMLKETLKNSENKDMPNVISRSLSRALLDTISPFK